MKDKKEIRMDVGSVRDAAQQLQKKKTVKRKVKQGRGNPFSMLILSLVSVQKTTKVKCLVKN